jgi:hypothetical protein
LSGCETVHEDLCPSTCGAEQGMTVAELGQMMDRVWGWSGTGAGVPLAHTRPWEGHPGACFLGAAFTSPCLLSSSPTDRVTVPCIDSGENEMRGVCR